MWMMHDDETVVTTNFHSRARQVFSLSLSDHTNEKVSKNSANNRKITRENSETGGERNERIHNNSSLVLLSGEDTSAWIGSVANLCSATLGAGVLAIPIAIYHAGIVYGMILLLCSAALTTLSIQYIAQACSYYQIFTYEKLAQDLFHPKLRKLVEFTIVLFCLGTAVAYMIAVGDILEQSHLLVKLGHSSHHSIYYSPRHLTMLLVWLCIMLPLSMLRKMETLQYASAIGIASIATLVFAAVVHLYTDEDEKDGSSATLSGLTGLFLSTDDSATTPGFDRLSRYLWPSNGWRSVLSACPIILFAYSCQVNVCAIYEELGPQRELMSKVSWTSVTICSLLYSSISLVALADFGSNVTPNILSSYESKGIMQVASLCMCLAVVMAFPLNIFPTRVTLSHVLFAPTENQAPPTTIGDPTLTAALLEDQTILETDITPSRRPTNEPRDAEAPDVTDGESSGALGEAKDLDLVPHVLLTLGIAGVALVLAILVPDVSVVFGLIGGTAASILGFCVPGLLGLRLAYDQQKSWSDPGWWIPGILFVGGSLIGIVTTAITLIDYVSN